MENRAYERALVIKVKYGDIIKRFTATVTRGLIDHNMTTLRKKIIKLFKLSPEAELVLTYVDGDGDTVALDDDDELRDAAIIQCLNPLRISVQLKSNADAGIDLKQKNMSSTIPDLKDAANQAPEIVSIIDEALKPVPEPIRSALSKISHDLLSKPSSTPTIANIVDYLSELGVSIGGQSVNNYTGESSGIPNQVTTPPGDLNVEEPNASNASAPSSTILYKQASEQLHDQHGSVDSSKVETENAPALDVNYGGTNIPTHEKATGYPSIDDLLSPVLLSPVWAINDITDPTKESGYGSRNGKSVVPVIPPFVPSLQNPEEHATYNPSPAPSVSYGYPGIPVDYSPKQLPMMPQLPVMPSGALDGFSFDGGKHISTVTSDKRFPNGFPPTPYQTGDRCNDNKFRIFHRGIRCDGCGMHPIIGPRYKSNVKENYDLCSICFSEMGNEADYTRIDRAHLLSRRMFKDSHNAPQHSRRPWSPSRPHGCARQSRAKLESRFIKDVTVFDGTLIPPSTPFTKIWRMRNNGTVQWPYGTRLVWVGGDKFANRDSFLLEIPGDGFPVNNELDVAVDLISPPTPGKYLSYWRLVSPSGQSFGQQVWVLIQVDISRPNSGTGRLYADLNLNLPPASTTQDAFGNIDVKAVPVGDVPPAPIPTDASEKLVKPFDDGTSRDDVNPAKYDKTGVVPPPTPELIPPVAYPSSVPPPWAAFDLAVPQGESSSSVPPPNNIFNNIEETLLKELEVMGFKQIDLNKEVLRLNKYDLEQSVDDLCGYSEWKPLLDELEDMGFSDRAKNKELLMKYDGSIKRVVLDLIAGEKA